MQFSVLTFSEIHANATVLVVRYLAGADLGQVLFEQPVEIDGPVGLRVALRVDSVEALGDAAGGRLVAAASHVAAAREEGRFISAVAWLSKNPRATAIGRGNWSMKRGLGKVKVFRKTERRDSSRARGRSPAGNGECVTVARRVLPTRAPGRRERGREGESSNSFGGENFPLEHFCSVRI